MERNVRRPIKDSFTTGYFHLGSSSVLRTEFHKNLATGSKVINGEHTETTETDVQTEGRTDRQTAL